MRIRHALAALVIAACLVPATSAHAVGGHDPSAPAHSGFTVSPPTAPYVMAFHTCSTNCEDPSNHLIRLVQSSDGVSWADVSGWQPYKGSVPDAFRRDNTLYVIGAGLTKIDMTTGKVTAARFEVNKSDGSSALARDVSFAGQLSDGRMVIVYVPSMQDVAGASEIPVLLATEVEGSDGSTFVNSGTAVTIPKSSLPVMGEPTDPDIFFNGSQWVLYTSVGNNIVAYTSSSVTGPYDLGSQAMVSREAGGVASGVVGSGGVWTFVNYGPSRESIEIRRAVSATGLSGLSTSSFSTVITGTPYGQTTAESPGIAANTTGITCGVGCAAKATAAVASLPKAGKPGSKCSKAGVQGTYKGRTLVCTRVKGKLIWR